MTQARFTFFHRCSAAAFARRAASLLACCISFVDVQAAPPVGEAAPDFALRAMSGENHRLSEHVGEVVLVNFWASWVGPSRQEMPALAGLYDKYQRAGLVMLGVNLDDDAARARDLAQAVKVSYPLLLDLHKEVARSYRVSAMPLTVLIDRNGIVRFTSDSYQPGDEKRYAEELRKLLNEQ